MLVRLILCYVYQEPDKGCFISPIEDIKASTQIIMVFDFEVLFLFSDLSFEKVLTTQDLVVKEGIYEYFVNFISCRWICTCCANLNLIDSESDDPVEDFIAWLLQAFDGNLEVIVYAHNGSR